MEGVDKLKRQACFLPALTPIRYLITESKQAEEEA